MPRPTRAARMVNCAACGQVMLVGEDAHMLAAFRCHRCALPQDRGPLPSHEAVRLFEPAPTQMPGQLSIDQ